MLCYNVQHNVRTQKNSDIFLIAFYYTYVVTYCIRNVALLSRMINTLGEEKINIPLAILPTVFANNKNQIVSLLFLPLVI